MVLALAGPRLDETDIEMVISAVTAHVDGEAMLSQVVRQQRTDPEFTRAHRLGVLRELLVADPAAFLRRCGPLLPLPMLPLFSRLNSYAVTAEVQALRVRLDTGKRRLQCKNRRLQYLNQLMPPGYFGMEEMAVRCPGLYHTYVGKYLSDADIAAKSEEAMNKSWSDQLMEVVVNRDVSQRREVAAAMEGWGDEDEDEVTAAAAAAGREPCVATGKDPEAFVAEEDSDSEADEPMANPTEPAAPTRANITPEDRARLRGEFERLVRERFLRGEDGEYFNYADADDNEALDDTAAADRDAEDAYFDED